MRDLKENKKPCDACSDFEEYEVITDSYDPSDYHGHKQTVDTIYKCITCGFELTAKEFNEYGEQFNEEN